MKQTARTKADVLYCSVAIHWTERNTQHEPRAIAPTCIPNARERCGRWLQLRSTRAAGLYRSEKQIAASHNSPTRFLVEFDLLQKKKIKFRNCIRFVNSPVSYFCFRFVFCFYKSPNVRLRCSLCWRAQRANKPRDTPPYTYFACAVGFLSWAKHR